MDALQALRFLFPYALRQSLRDGHRKLVFARAMKAFLRSPEQAISRTGSHVLRDLVYGWGNESWSAQDEYLAACLRQVASSQADILECGSGLSTLLLGVMAKRFGRRVWSLEHNAHWGQRVQQSLDRYQIDSVRLWVRPLTDYGEFTWYDAAPDALPASFDLVICDGPPGSTRGGRYGLAPVMKDRLLPGAVILLDDGGRPEEQSIATRWADELGAQSALVGRHKPYIRLQLPQAERPAGELLKACVG